MGETTKEQRDGLRRLAEEATAGPWVRWVDHGTVVAGPVTVNEPGRISGARTTICEVEDDDGWEDDDDLADAGANAEFIAAANPETVLALLNALAASEAAALVVDVQAEALLERATAAEAARERAERERDEARAERIAPGQDDDGTPFASAASWRAANREAAAERDVLKAENEDLRGRSYFTAMQKAESALAEARRGREALAAEWGVQADIYDAESAAPTMNDDERRTALVKFVTAIALRDCARKLRALTPGADAPQTKEKAP